MNDPRKSMISEIRKSSETGTTGETFAQWYYFMAKCWQRMRNGMR